MSWLWCQLYWQNRKNIIWKDSYCTGVQHLFDIASLHSSLFTSSAPIQNSDKFDLRTTRINLVQDNTEIIDRHKNWNILLFKEAQKIKESNSIFNSELKASKELQLFWIDGNITYTNLFNIQLITSLTQSWN